MTTEQQEEQASLYVAGAMTAEEKLAFETQLRGDPALSELVRTLERAAALLALAVPPVALPPRLKDEILQHIETVADNGATPVAALPPPPRISAGFLFHSATDPTGWKALPLPGAWIKLLSFEPERRTAVLLGKLDPGVRYPAHTHAGAEDLFILTGDLHIGEFVLGPGDFHHSDAGTFHPDNHSVGGCTLLAILSENHELAQFAMH